MNEGGDISLTPWFGTLNGYSATYPRTAIDISDTSNIQSVNLYNTYVETGTFVIQKIDAGLDGKGSTPMPNVAFKVFDITKGTAQEVQLTRKWNASTGRYNLQDYDPNGTPITGDPMTGADGCIYLRLAAPNAEGADQNRIFKIVEQVPNGYLTDAEQPYVIVTVDNRGLFEISEKMHKPVGDHGKIEVLRTGVPGEDEEDALVNGVTIYNQPKPVAIAVGKQWDSLNEQDSVTLNLTATVGGKTSTLSTVVLDEKNAVDSGNMDETEPEIEDNTHPEGEYNTDPDGVWVYRWPEAFPMMVGNVKVIYKVNETKIGAYSSGSAAFNNWKQG